MQAGLNPVLIDTRPALSLYGVGIDLEHLDAHRAADEQALRQELAEIEGQRAQLDQLQQQAEQTLKACEKVRRQADEALALANAELHKAGTRLASARQEVEAAGRRVEQSRQAAKAQAEARLQAIEQEQAVIEGQIRDLDQDHRDAVKVREDRHGQERGALDAERQAALDDHDRAQDERRQRQAQERAGITSERDQALGAAGVDTAALTALQGEMDDADQQLRRIDQGRNEVNQWQLWQQNDWPRQAEHAAAARAARDLETAARADLAAEEARWKARAAELDGALRALDREHARLEQEAAAVRGRLDGFRDYPADAQVMGQPFDPGWTLDALTAQANGNQQEATGLGQVIGKLVEQIKRAFAAQRGTPPDDFYESHRTGLGPDAPARAWVPVFKGWFDTDHDAYRRTLAVEANQIAGAIVAFHRDMESFHRKVQQFNRELQQSLDENLGFESVSWVTVEVKSVIRELEYWQPIEAMAEEQRAWLSLHGQDLPPPAFAATLRTLLEHWEVREGIRAALPNLIRIQGEVVENGQTRTFRKAADLERVSSNGLSYLILCVIFIAFINRIRRGAAVEICWALDELKDLDIGNIEALLTILRRNAITLVSAFPDPDADVLALFRHRFSVEEGRRLMEARVVGADEGDLEPKVSPS